MTFTEAAIEILKHAGRPLHYKTITQIAIEKNLLSHVGKTPEVTMSSRLATMVKNDGGDAPLVKVKPGVFGLRDFTPEQLAMAEAAGDEPDLSELQLDIPEQDASAAAEAHASAAGAALRAGRGEGMASANLFPEEEDDDEPILGKGDEKGEDEEDDGEGRSGRRRRRRRRPGAGSSSPTQPSVGASSSGGGQSGSSVGGRSPDRPDRSDRDRGYSDRGDEGFARGSSESDELPQDESLVGKTLADAVYTWLAAGSPQVTSSVRIAEGLVRRGRLQGEPSALAPTVSAAVRADIARTKSTVVAGGMKERPRFRMQEGQQPKIALAEWWMPRDAVRLEQEALRAADRQREQVRRAFVRRLADLPTSTFVEMIASWLNAEGVSGLRAVRRPGTGNGEIHLAGMLRRGFEELHLAIVVYRDGRELNRERVIEVRGALHSYGNASAAWLLTLGQVRSGGVEEASAVGAAPCLLLDGQKLAEAMERHGIGVRTYAAPLTVMDVEFLDSLRGVHELVLRDEGRRPHERDARGQESRPERGSWRERNRDRDRDRTREARQRPESSPDVSPEGAADASDGVAGDVANNVVSETSAERPEDASTVERAVPTPDVSPRPEPASEAVSHETRVPSPAESVSANPQTESFEGYAQRLSES
jgi:hypothetical protein